MNKKIWLILGGLLVIATIIIGIFFRSKITTKEIITDDFIVTYDTTWKLKKEENGITLKHKKTKSKIQIQCMVLEDSYLDTPLKEIIQDITYSIEEQNDSYQMINTLDSPSNIYDSYSYLYEDDMDQALVNIYKKDNKVIVAYYSAPSEVFDILLDSVDNIFDSIEIKTGEEIKLT